MSAFDPTRLDQASIWHARRAEGELPLDEQLAFDAWLAEPANHEAYAASAVGLEAVEALGSTPELIVLRSQALDAARRANQDRWRKHFRLDRRAAAAALVLVIAGAGAGTWARYVPRSYTTGVDDRRVLALSDGSRLSLDASTEVAVRYFGDRRELWLRRGRAKFEVAHDPKRPFSVAAGGKVVVATGTAFSVELLRRQVRVVLLQGHVKVLDAPKGADRIPIRLAAENRRADDVLMPGRELIVGVDEPVAEVAQVDPVRSLAWEAGQLVFTDEPLPLAVERVNRYSKDKVILGDPQAAAVVVNGVYPAGDPQAFVEGVTAVAPLRVSRSEGVNTLYSR